MEEIMDPEGPVIKFSVVFFGPRANAELVAKINVHDTHPALPKISLNILAKTQPSQRD